MRVAVVVYGGVFDSGLTAILDVLDNYEHANTLRVLLRERTGKTIAALRSR